MFSVSPWARLSPGDPSRRALRARRRLGLAFGWHHLAHLAVLLAYLAASGQQLNPGRAAGGMAAYAALVAIMATSNDGAVRRLGPVNWKRLHRSGLWLLWLAFVLTYVPRLLGKVPTAGGGMAEFVPCALLLAALAGLRLCAARR